MAFKWPEAGVSANDFWESFYSERDQVWTGNPNVALVAEIADVPPGRALDLGCGEGGDAVWLAERGWTVTAIDISAAAIARGAGAASARGLEGSIRWECSDLEAWQPAEQYDLVNAEYLHSPVEFARERVLRTAATAVKPGGILLIVGHAAPPSWQEPRPTVHLPTAEEVLDSLTLEPGGWQIERMEEFVRDRLSPEGEPGTHRDNVLRLRRIGG